MTKPRKTKTTSDDRSLSLGARMVAGARKFLGVARSGKPIEDHFPVRRVRIVESRKVAPNVYEITTESEKYGRTTQRVLVLPDRVVVGDQGDS